ncbi:hypothetical protein VNO77_21697 [Canavalia gladiata]|uniref:Uncharacterized protein n=1 Tax=Canavalia gladiata TaxID=3824 RepID=A0AAN9LVS1_CANGL
MIISSIHSAATQILKYLETSELKKELGPCPALSEDYQDSGVRSITVYSLVTDNQAPKVKQFPKLPIFRSSIFLLKTLRKLAKCDIGMENKLEGLREAKLLHWC